jgi:phosphate transport system substrate-binding protein
MAMALFRCGSKCWRTQCVLRLVAALLLLPPVLMATGDRGAMAQTASETLVFAGCDSNIPLTRLLARVFAQTHPEVRIQLKTVGSTNGVALAAAGAIQIGLVSRPLRDAEDGLGLTFLPYARTAVIIGADPDTPDTTLTAADLLSFYRGSKLTWNSGREVAFLTREEGDSSVATLKQAMPGFAEAYAAGSNTSHWTVLYSEPTMHEALLTRRFALGLSDLGTTTLERLPIKVLSIDGIAPTPETVASGRYPFVKTLGFVWREDTLPASARAFVEFVQSDDGAGLLRAHGYLPVR